MRSLLTGALLFVIPVTLQAQANSDISKMATIMAADKACGMSTATSLTTNAQGRHLLSRIADRNELQLPDFVRQSRAASSYMLPFIAGLAEDQREAFCVEHEVNSNYILTLLNITS